MKRFKNLFLFFALLMFAFSCDGSGSSDNGSDTKGENNTTSTKSQFKGKIEGSDDAPGEVENSVDKPVKDQFSAAISGQMLTIYILAKEGYLITANIVTSDERVIPGSFTPNGMEVTVALVTPTATFMSTDKGTITINDCAEAINDKITGSFNNIELKEEMSGKTMTLNGDFTVYVMAVADPALVCKEKPAENDTNEGDKDVVENPDIAPSSCDFNPETHGCTGVCCPYLECAGSCVMQKCMGDCMNPNASDACIQCMNQCDSDCKKSDMTPECESKLNTLMDCTESHDCGDTLADEETMKCAKTYCCDELKAAFY